MNIIEFAKQLNLSTGTVSRAMNDRPEVSPNTRRLVLEKAKELGFSPNASARRLVIGRTNLFQLECPQNTHILSDQYLVELARALEEAAGEHGYDLLLHLGTRRRELAEVEAVDGLVVVGGPETNAEDLQLLTSGWRSPTVVIIDSQHERLSQVSYIAIDNLPGARKAIERLAGLGHRRISYIGSGEPADPLPVALPKLMADAHLDFDPSLVVAAGTTQSGGYNAATKLLTSTPRPTAIFARTDILAAAAVQAANDLHLSVPKDVSIIGHDDIEIASLVNPPLTTVAIDIPSVAGATISSLLGMIADKSFRTSRVIETKLVIRGSDGPAPKL